MNPADGGGTMSLLDHIRELRRRVVRALLCLAAGTGLGLLVFNRAWDFLKRPWCRIPAAHRLGDKSACMLVYNGITDGFVLHLKIAVIIGAVISAPAWMYQLWAFLAPGLYRHERRWTYIVVGSGTPLFLFGAALAYLTLDQGLKVLTGFAPSGSVAMISVDSYLSYLTGMTLVFGLTTELPLLVTVLNLAGILSHARIRSWRRGVIFAIFVFTAVAVPSPDPFTMLALAMPTIVLFEVAELLAFLHDRRRARRADVLDLPDDRPTPHHLIGGRS